MVVRLKIFVPFSIVGTRGTPPSPAVLAGGPLKNCLTTAAWALSMASDADIAPGAAFVATVADPATPSTVKVPCMPASRWPEIEQNQV